MHFNFPFTFIQVIWTLTFAADLILLVVLLGRERIARYPWFFTSIALFALRLLADMLLTGRLPTFILQAITIALACVAAIVSLLVVLEIGQRAFGSVPRLTWINGVMALVVVAVTILAFWGPWPLRKDLTWDSPLAVLKLMQLAAQKADLLADLLTVEVGLLVVVFGRRFKAGWRSHTQSIAIGLAAVSIGWLSVQAIWLNIARNAHPTTRLELEHIIALGTRLVNANKIVYLAALIWWIVWLWFDEPGTEAAEIPAVVAQDQAPVESADALEQEKG